MAATIQAPRASTGARDGLESHPYLVNDRLRRDISAPSSLWSMSTYHLAQMNIARMRAPLTDPVMAGFVAQLDAMNALADRTPGFVWRLEEHGLHTPDDALLAYAADSVLVNLSVWEGVEPLQRYVYHSAHGGLLRDRRDWFEKMEDRWVVLWWVPAGHRPGVAEGKERLEHLRAHGMTAHAFNFKQTFAPPEENFPTDFP